MIFHSCAAAERLTMHSLLTCDQFTVWPNSINQNYNSVALISIHEATPIFVRDYHSECFT